MHIASVFCMLVEYTQEAEQQVPQLEAKIAELTTTTLGLRSALTTETEVLKRQREQGFCQDWNMVELSAALDSADAALDAAERHFLGSPNLRGVDSGQASFVANFVAYHW